MRKNLKLIIPFIMFAVTVPILLDLFVFGNTYPSNIDNNSWAGFLGSFLGSIIGGGCTCWAVMKQKEDADRQRQIDEISQIRPYIVADRPTATISGTNVKNVKLAFDIFNIELNSACDIEIYAYNADWKEPLKLIERGKYCLTVNSRVRVTPNFNFAETVLYEFHFIDLKGNLYCQEFRYDQAGNSFISLEPKKHANLFESLK